MKAKTIPACVMILLLALGAWAQSKPLKILLIYDFEGCSGVTRAEQVMAFNGEPYTQRTRGQIFIVDNLSRSNR